MMGFLTLAPIARFAVMRLGLSLGRSECWAFLFLYAVFVAWVPPEGAGITALMTR